MNPKITITTVVQIPPEKAWMYWTSPTHIIKWNAASDDWHTPRATADLKEGGKFTSRMEAKDGSVGFDFEGTFTKVVPATLLEYSMPDGRAVSVVFQKQDGGTLITETFDPENENPIEMQRGGWQAILENFKKYAEAHG